jgi:hypothetical protein
MVVLALLLSAPIAVSAQQIEPAAPRESSQAPVTPTPSQAPDPHAAMEQEPTRMQLRGFADMRFHASNDGDVPSTFSVGQLDLFITSQLASDLNLVGEVVFEADDDNHYSVDVERLLLQFSPSDYLDIGIGRYHTGIGFYNNAYHHGAWFQTALGRPHLFEFEDDEGILPVHGVGITARGLVPSGRLGLHWIAEVGNGRRYGDAEAVQVVQDADKYKAVNFGFFVRPESVPGLQAGLSVYHDKPSSASGRVSQSITAAHVVYQSGVFEQLNEVVILRDTPVDGGATSTSTGVYTQLSRRFGRLSPYFRYEHLDIAQDDPLFGAIESVSGPSLGLRYDFRDLAALKVQWDRFTRRHGAAVNGVTAQVAFTF